MSLPLPSRPAWPSLAAAQAGLVARRQLATVGVTDKFVASQLRARRWQRVHEGVYATFTGALTWDQRLAAALLYAGAGACASHETAAALHGLAPPAPLVHVTIPARRQIDDVPGVRFHRSRRLGLDEVLVGRDPPRTRVERTVIDLVAVARTLDEAFGWLAGAVQQRRTTAARLRAAVLHRRTLRWRSYLLAALDDIASGVHSNLERVWLRIERGHRLPRARRQAAARRSGGNRWLDCEYEAYGVRADLDGRLGHDALVERWRDMQRDNEGVVAGRSVLRYGWADLQVRGCDAAAQVAGVLRSRGWRGRPEKCGPRCPV